MSIWIDGETMQSTTLRKWLAERGCTFESHPEHRHLGSSSVTVRLGSRCAELPFVGSKKRLPEEVVRKAVADLGLDPAQLPGPKSRV
jgi:hypothetical protein